MRIMRCNILLIGLHLIVVLTVVFGCAAADRKPLACPERAVFGDPEQSAYILPYPPGESYRVAQGCCYPHGGHRNQLAYDFEMPIGCSVIAARAGIVRRLRSDLPDDGRESEAGQHNHIMIQHDDGTVAFYAHLQRDSIQVEVGEHVAVGRHIANSGNSGNTLGLPHLHFGVYRGWPAREGFDVPVNFRNAEGRLDARKGLRPGTTYRALDY